MVKTAQPKIQPSAAEALSSPKHRQGGFSLPRREFSREEIVQIRQLSREGVRHLQIAAKYEVPLRRIRNICYSDPTCIHHEAKA
jgi:hypothetical protein